MLNPKAFKERMIDQAIERLKLKLLSPSPHADNTATKIFEAQLCRDATGDLHNDFPAKPKTERLGSLPKCTTPECRNDRRLRRVLMVAQLKHNQGD